MTEFKSYDTERPENNVTISYDDSFVNVHEEFEYFIKFLKAKTYSGIVIYHGLQGALEVLKEEMWVNSKSYQEEVKVNVES